MLSSARFDASLPCGDFERAKRFYEEKLGLRPVDDQPMGATYKGRDGTRFLLYPSGGEASGTHTQMGFVVADVEAEVRDLEERGVRFEEYDLPGFDKATGIAKMGDTAGAWFKDSEGNLLGIIQMP